MNITITKHEKILKIGKDLVDAVSGKLASHGSIEVNGSVRYDWVSTLPIGDSERILRRAVTKEHKKVTLFMSQAI